MRRVVVVARMAGEETQVQVEGDTEDELRAAALKAVRADPDKFIWQPSEAIDDKPSEWIAVAVLEEDHEGIEPGEPLATMSGIAHTFGASLVNVAQRVMRRVFDAPIKWDDELTADLIALHDMLEHPFVAKATVLKEVKRLQAQAKRARKH